MRKWMLPPLVIVVCGLTVGFASADAPKKEAVPDRKLELADRLRALPAALLKALKTDKEIVDAAFLATLMRFPTDDQRENVIKSLKNYKNREQACEDMIWALVSTREFRQLHGFTIQEISELSDEISKKK